MSITFKYKKSIPFKKIDKEFREILAKIEDLRLPKDFLQFILYTLSELFANVEEHSQAKKILLEIKINKGICFLKISDDGIGLKKSYLLKNIYPKDDFSAIEFALSGLSTKTQKERGFGLYSIRKFVESLEGEMIIETEKAISIIQKNKIQFKNSLKKKKGASVSLKTKIKALDFYKILR